jgi:hypothetical protein
MIVGFVKRIFGIDDSGPFVLYVGDVHVAFDGKCDYPLRRVKGYTVKRGLLGCARARKGKDF